jgi:hypothetical protein
MLQFVLPQLPYIAPMLVVSVTGAVLSLVHLKRLGKTAEFALIACIMVFLATSVLPFVQGYIVASREDRQWPMAEFSLWMSVVGLVRTLLQAIGFSLLLAAIFQGRTSPEGKPDPLGSGGDEIWN